MELRLRNPTYGVTRLYNPFAVQCGHKGAYYLPVNKNSTKIISWQMLDKRISLVSSNRLALNTNKEFFVFKSFIRVLCPYHGNFYTRVYPFWIGRAVECPVCMRDAYKVEDNSISKLINQFNIVRSEPDELYYEGFQETAYESLETMGKSILRIFKDRKAKGKERTEYKNRVRARKKQAKIEKPLD